MAKQKESLESKKNLEQLIASIQEANDYFLQQIQKQVNTSLTLRIGLLDTM